MGSAPVDVAVCLMGPTATGKTELALALAERLPVGLVSVDSAMVYRHLDIGSYEQAVAVIKRFYPLERFPQKTLYALGELLPKQG